MVRRWKRCMVAIQTKHAAQPATLTEDAKMDELQRKRTAAAVSLIIILKRERLRRLRKTRTTWVRKWLARRTEGRGVLSMLHKELRVDDPAAFRNYSRLEEDLFEELLTRISARIERRDTVMREAITPRDRLSATLRFLATGNSYQDLAYSTRIALSTLSIIIPETLRAIICEFQDECISCPNSPSEWLAVEAGFHSLWQFRHCIASVDGKHINFRPPRKSGSYYRNYKSRDSIVLLAAVDASYKFLFVDIGQNGRMNDGAVFRDSKFNRHLKAGSLNLPECSPLPGSDFPLPHVAVADDAFPLSNNIMKPYPERGLTSEKRIFNYRLSRARRIVENAFGIMANRFRILLTVIALSVEKVELISLTCCILHNFILKRKPQYNVAPEDGAKNSECPRLQSVENQAGHNPTRCAKAVRDQFVNYFNTVGAVPWQDEAVQKGNF